MYDDGYAGSNTGCTAPGSAQCWGHRDIILADDVPGALVAGAGFQTGLSYGNSYALGLAGYAPGSRLVFSWAGELRYFRAAARHRASRRRYAGPPVLTSP